MTVEYRLVVKRWDRVTRFPKRDLAHAEKGLDDMVDDFLNLQSSYVGANAEAWIERREVGKWEAVEYEEAEK